MCRTLIIQKEGGSRRENSRCQAQKLLVDGRTGFSGCQIYAFSPLPHRPNEEELRMKNVDDNTPAVGYCEDRTESNYESNFLNWNWNIVGYNPIYHSPQ